MKNLYIIRHAKSSWKDASLTDFERPLNKRGDNDAPFMGQVLKNKGILPDLIISSPATRAKSTSSIIAQEIAYSGEILLDKRIYEASSSELLQLVNGIEDKYSSVFIFGHNPGFTYLAESLSGEYFGNIPTCGVVGISFDFEEWAMISSDTGSVFLYDFPKNHQ